ncbi:MAG TPA: diaminopimelate decarboxylase [Terriglobales bacterium]|nr:diaminopimelate decarboxylase [Terriglobales bacterium]
MSELHHRPPGFLYSSARTTRELRCEHVPLETLAKRFGTPLYVYSAGMIRDRVKAFHKAFVAQDYAICYSVKANSTLGILRLLASLGCGFDVVSGGELQRVARLGRGATETIVFSGVGKTVAEMESALKIGILLFNLESASELDSLARTSIRLKRKARVAIRVNPDVPADTHPYISTGLHKHKFGVPIAEARELYQRIAKAKYLQVSGVSAHIGSQIRDFSSFREAMERVAELVRQLRHDGHQIQFVDAGGGMGINYGDGSEDFRSLAAEYSKAVTSPLQGLGVKLLLEPGRAIVGPAGVLLTRVIYRKTNGERRFVIVDAAMNDLIRPSLYQAHHEIVPVSLTHSEIEVVDVVGPICESGDFFARDRELSVTREGDLLAILDAGAYGMVLASNYNTRPRPAEVLVGGKSAKVIRKRETAADLMRAEL